MSPEDDDPTRALINAGAHLSPEAKDALLERAHREHVSLLVDVRVAQGSWPADQPLTSFHVLLPEDGEVSVRVNDEDHAWSLPRTTRDYLPDERIDLADLEVRRLPLRDGTDTPFVRAWIEADGWKLKFQYRFPHPRRVDELEAASQFLAAAVFCAQPSLARAFVENAFHAAEHLARAELLSYSPTIDPALKRRRHGGLWDLYNAWSDLGNTPALFSELIKRLVKLRPDATYLAGSFALAGEEQKQLLASLQEMHAYVVRLVEHNEMRNPVNVFATRTIEAGSSVTDEDFELRRKSPPRDSQPKTG